MNQKFVGIVLILIGITSVILTFNFQKQEEHYINQIVGNTGSCFLEDGTCLHEEKNNITSILGYAFGIGIILFGTYITFFDKTTQNLMKHQQNITTALEKSSKAQKEKDEFKAFLSGFDDREQKVLKIIHSQEGILQSSLRYKTNLSKAMLSNILSDLEKRGFISRKDKGKSKQIFLIQKI